MPCVFCGGKPVTKEHLWPEWVRGLLPETEAKSLHAHTMSGTDRPRQTFQAPAFSMTVKDACGSCNNGWMSRLEERTKRIATGMLTGRGRVLYEGEQTTLAAWATVKALMLQRVNPSDTWIPAQTYREMYDLQTRPPDHIKVYIGAVDWQHQPGFYDQTALSPDKPDLPGTQDAVQAYLSTFSVLRLVMQVFQAYWGPAELGHPPGIAPAVRQIWPVLGPFTFPLAARVTERGLAALSPNAARP